MRHRKILVALALAATIWIAAFAQASAEVWDAAADWGSFPANPNGPWNYMGGWVASENPLTAFDGVSIEGFERWGRFDSPDDFKPFIGVNTSDQPIEIGGLTVPAGALVMDTLPNPLGPGISPILRWMAYQTGEYEITATLRNLSDRQPSPSGVTPDGVEWLVYRSGFEIVHSQNVDAGQSDQFHMTTTIEAGTWYAIVFNARANNYQDLSEITFTIRKLD